MKKRKNRKERISDAGLPEAAPSGDLVAETSAADADAADGAEGTVEAIAGSGTADDSVVPPAVEGDGAPRETSDDEVTSRMELVAAEGPDPLDATTQDTVEQVEADILAEVALPAGDLDAGASEAALSDAGLSEPEPASLVAASSEGDEASDGTEALPVVEGSRLESIIESLLFAADRPLVVNELKRLLGERDGKRITAALDALKEQRAESGIQLVSVAGGWQLRTHPANGAWVAKLVAGRPTRLSRAMMETLAIVAYRQPITRPEIDEIRGVDCGPVLRTLLDRGLIRSIGKKEEVGRPILYGTTPEFLKIFSLRDLADLPTLREFHELGADDRAKVDATAGPDGALAVEGALGVTPGVAGESLRAGELPDVDSEEEDSLIEALEHATLAAGRAERSLTDPEPEPGADAVQADVDRDGAAASRPSSGAQAGAEAGSDAGDR